METNRYLETEGLTKEQSVFVMELVERWANRWKSAISPDQRSAIMRDFQSRGCSVIRKNYKRPESSLMVQLAENLFSKSIRWER